VALLGTATATASGNVPLSACLTAAGQATANYTHARIFFDQAMGRTLEVNHISMEEAIEGQVKRASAIPEGVK